ncbi:hypothetical protein, conserved [Babesia bigemina]|uniref:C3H1-type domain-containing protein n=1 Tax=Babesia bigemina TaxID=5866 RepID=A0A061BKE3_BABBI|nr:hypothetical protein, conserved [Babesia bigemina]CDR71393.1 hypothetical protein, conserved [Babesia bigemina]|eukprot:XP_012770343.1 hypothetical protein, conserved [Babesia bigemina]
MGFLSGVLGAVKDENEVTTYDKHLDKRLETVLEEVNKKIGSGRTGLVDAVGAVKGWLEGYEREVGKKTKAVTDKLGELSSGLNSVAGTYYQEVMKQENAPLATQLEAWKIMLRNLKKEVTKIKYNHVNELDSALHDRLNNEIEPIIKVIDQLKKVGDNKEYETQVAAVDHELVEQKVYVCGQIDNKSEELKRALDKKLNEVYTYILNLDDVEVSQFTTVKSDVKIAKRSVDMLVGGSDQGFDEKYKKVILQNFDVIREKLQDLDKEKNTKGGKTNSTIHDDVENIRSNIEVQVRAAQQEVSNLEEAVQATAREAYNKVCALVGEATAALGNLGTEVDKGLNKLKAEIDRPIEEVINKLKDGIGSASNAQSANVVIQEFNTALDKEVTRNLHAWSDTAMRTGGLFNAIKKLEWDTRLFGYFKDVLKQLGEKQNDKGTFYEELVGDLKQKMHNAIEAVKSTKGKKFSDVFQELTTQIKNGGISNETVYKKIDGIKTSKEIEDIKDMSVNKAGLQNAIDLFKKDADNGGTKSKVKEAIDHVLLKVRTMQEVPGEVTKLRTETETLLQQLKAELDKLQRKIENVERDVNKAAAEIQKAIRAVHVSVIDAHQMAERAIRALANDLTQEVKDAFSIITSEVQNLFANERHADLNALKELVEERAVSMEKIMKKDFDNGIKGLLKKMNSNLGEIRIKERLNSMFTDINAVITGLITYIMIQIHRLSPQHTQLENIKKAFSKLFEHLSYATYAHYDHIAAAKHEKLKEEIVAFSSKQFAAPQNPQLLDTVKTGLTALVNELDNAYINKYEGYPAMKWVDTKENKETLTADAQCCAKVFVTMLGMIFEDMSTLKAECDRRFSKSTISLSSDLGCLFKRYGYVVAKDSKSQDGELRRSDEMNGTAVRVKIVGNYPCVFNSSADTKHAINSLFDCLETYNQVCHLSTFNARRQPCSVYEMLVWFAGLPYNNVYAVLLSDGLTSVLTKPKRKPIETGDADFEVEFDDLKAYYADTYPNRVTHGDINAALDHICSTSYDVLATIAGHGDEFTTYAADFCTNSLKLKYPASGEECLYTIVDILRRMLPQLQYLFSRCKLSAMHGGWSQCLYGKDVTTTKWPCNNHSTDKPSTKANCQPTSPLMSYISDSLPGHQPHQLSSIGCKYDCANCPSASKKGMPCLTPLGFRGFSGSTRRGEDICEILEKLFSNFYLSSLFCLAPKTPASLPEHYGFVLSLVDGWHSTKTSRKGLIMESIEEAIKKQSIELYDDTSKLTNALANAYGSSQTIHQDKNHLGPLVDLSSLSMNTVCRKKDEKLQCAPYLTSLCVDAYIYSTQKQSNTYLSWAIYLPWSFWDLLNNLYNSFCSINCQDWGCRGCLRGDKCKKGEHGSVNDKTKQSNCQCPSIVDCKGVAPTLYQYGFVFGEASTLNSESPKKCSDFCSQLKKVLNSEYFKKLFEECDNFLWIIRQPFSYLVLSLWLLSLLYLLHIMVIRLDLLHIKSHLHSPSSHRIAAQSLLAAARVNKLNRVFYLQP